jgi:hypothetical protein
MRTTFNEHVDRLVRRGIDESWALLFVAEVMDLGARAERHRQGQDKETAMRVELAGRPWDEVKAELQKTIGGQS